MNLDLGFQSLGCWKDTWDRAIEPLEGKHKLLMDINYRLREDPLRKCAVAALENHLQLFAIENGGQCLGDKTAAYLYQRFGRAHKCKGTITTKLIQFRTTYTMV